jgi:hypothetical protein
MLVCHRRLSRGEKWFSVSLREPSVLIRVGKTDVTGNHKRGQASPTSDMLEIVPTVRLDLTNFRGGQELEGLAVYYVR